MWQNSTNQTIKQEFIDHLFIIKKDKKEKYKEKTLKINQVLFSKKRR